MNTTWSVQTRITCELTAFCSDNIFFSSFFIFYLFQKPLRSEKKGDGYATRLLQCPKEAEDKSTEEGKARQRFFFFFTFSIFYSFINYSTIKRGTKSHQFPLVLYILLWRSRGRKKYRSLNEGIFLDGHSGLQDGVCEQKALFRDNLYDALSLTLDHKTNIYSHLHGGQ